jgi:hypothetical protein
MARMVSAVTLAARMVEVLAVTIRPEFNAKAQRKEAKTLAVS